MTRLIFALVGPSRSGKSTLINRMLEEMPDLLGVVKSVTTRPRRDPAVDPDDDRNYDFLTAAEFEALNLQGRMIQSVFYADNWYGNDRKTVDALLAEKHGICALVEAGVRNFRDAGYEVFVIQVIPLDYRQTEDEGRKMADLDRSLSGLDPDLPIVNSHRPGGLDQAVRCLARDIRNAIEKREADTSDS